ncbi:hypothetical protein [Methylobacterium sp. Leaf94]|uniref:hypothetical protein n=1 Tax=Methylobacterium sp. Leaf94 TaxID=1736250 RepID=UPI0012E37AD6|nr:hypothetical protein [Methylobacterium sp. Leaf94]
MTQFFPTLDTKQGKIGDKMIQIDLNAPTIPDTQKVWRLFPGEGYQFLDNFEEQGIAFLDTPGLVLPDGDLSDVDDWGPRIAHSQGIKNFISEYGPDEEYEINLEDFADATAQGRGRARMSIINFFNTAKHYDIVVLPSPVRMGKILIGQIGNRRRVKGFAPEKYGNTFIPARSVEWIGSFRENTISTKLSESLRNQHAFTLLEKSLKLEVCALAFGSFVSGDNYVSTVYNQDSFRDSDAAFLSNLSRLAAAACISLDLGEAGLNPNDIVDILLREPPLQYTCLQESDIHSEGFTRYISQSIVSFVIVALASSYIQLSQVHGAEQMQQEIKKMVIMNSSPNADPRCTSRVSEAVKRIYDMVPMDKTMAICDAARSTGGRGILPSARPRNGN